ncbi:DUF452 family protein [Pasteurellaceae bacterium LIM206]|nr:DUF452 family protein [Pasteurellaceae bacterium LIM206]
MQTRLINRGQQHLIVYFAGWGTTPDAIKHLTLPINYDLLICYDYQDLALDFDFSPYRHMRTVAWSMGVWAAERAMRHIPLLSATAINGTGLPCHDRYGIPRDIFAGTMAGLNAAARTKFERRMCADKTVFAQYQQFTARPLENVRQELTALDACLQQDMRTDLISWTNSWIGTRDRIFPVENQLAYWRPRCAYQTADFAHYPFLSFSTWEQLWTSRQG